MSAQNEFIVRYITNDYCSAQKRKCSLLFLAVSIYIKISSTYLSLQVSCSQKMFWVTFSATFSRKHSHMWPAAIYGIAHPHSLGRGFMKFFFVQIGHSIYHLDPFFEENLNLQSEIWNSICGTCYFRNSFDAFFQNRHTSLNFPIQPNTLP